MKKPLSIPTGLVLVLFLFFAFAAEIARCQGPAPQTTKPAQKPGDASEKLPELPARIELLETRVRFEPNGDSRKEVHTRVRINNEVGARQFARLAFDYNRAFQQIEFPLVRVTHSGGGTAEILPSAISDNPNPAVATAPAFQDIRVKSVRILGLETGDALEYRVVTTTSHHPLAPDFWLDHTFDRSGITSKEIFEIDLPGSLYFESRFPPGCPQEWMVGGNNLTKVRVCGSIPFSHSSETSTEGSNSRSVLRWDVNTTSAEVPAEVVRPEVTVSTFDDGLSLVERLAAAFNVNAEDQRELRIHLQAIAPNPGSSGVTLQDAYEFISQKLATVDLPVGATGFRPRPVKDVLSSGYATAEEKCMLLAAFAQDFFQVSRPAHANTKPTTDVQIVFPTSHRVQEEYVRPSILEQPLVVISDGKRQFALAPSLEVAPFAFIPVGFRGKLALSLTPASAGDYRLAHSFVLPTSLPFAASQRVNVEAVLTVEGTLNAKVHYLMRGDSELLLRQAFHQSSRDKWKDVAQLLALSDGFRGKISNVTASDPSATKEPFMVEYEITQPKFVDWSKKPVRIPALLPQVGLPDPPAKSPSGSAASAIELGTPLDVDTRLTLHLPAGTLVRTPTGTSVERDYATFASKYDVAGGTVTASRRLNFLLRTIAADRVGDYSAFINAVQGDEAQRFTLERADGPGEAKPAAGSNVKKD